MTAERLVMVTRSELEDLDSLCHGIVTHLGTEDACSKPATTILYDRESRSLWPACTWHAHRYGSGVGLPLATAQEARRVGCASFAVPTIEDY